MNPIYPILVLFLFLIIVVGSRQRSATPVSKSKKSRKNTQPSKKDLDDSDDSNDSDDSDDLNLICGKFEAFSPLLTTQEVPPEEQSRFQQVKSIDPQSRKIIADFFSSMGLTEPSPDKLVIANGCIPILFITFQKAKDQGARKVYAQKPMDFVYTGILEELQLEIVSDAAVADLEIVFPIGLDGTLQQRQTTGIPVVQICTFVSPAFLADGIDISSISFDPREDSIWTFSTLFSLGGCRFGFGFLRNAGEIQQQIASRHLGLTHSGHYIVQQLFRKTSDFQGLISESRKLIAKRWRQLKALGVPLRNSSGPFAVIEIGLPEVEMFGIVAQGTQSTSWIPLTLSEKRWNEFRSRIKDLI